MFLYIRTRTTRIPGRVNLVSSNKLYVCFCIYEHRLLEYPDVRLSFHLISYIYVFVYTNTDYTTRIPGRANLVSSNKLYVCFCIYEHRLLEYPDVRLSFHLISYMFLYIRTQTTRIPGRANLVSSNKLYVCFCIYEHRLLEYPDVRLSFHLISYMFLYIRTQTTRIPGRANLVSSNKLYVCFCIYEHRLLEYPDVRISFHLISYMYVFVYTNTDY